MKKIESTLSKNSVMWLDIPPFLFEINKKAFSGSFFLYLLQSWRLQEKFCQKVF